MWWEGVCLALPLNFVLGAQPRGLVLPHKAKHFYKTIPLAVFGYKVIIANLALCASLSIYHLIQYMLVE